MDSYFFQQITFFISIRVLISIESLIHNNSYCPFDNDVSNISFHEEVKVGQEGQQVERSALKTVKSTTVFSTQIRLLESESSNFIFLVLIK
jgi:hypothetical protein